MTFEAFTESKIWGEVQHIFSSPHAGVSCLTVKRGYRCSIHYHKDRYNLFNVLEGIVIVEVFGNTFIDSSKNVTRAILRAGDTCTVRPLAWHRFRVLRRGRIVEVYWPADGAIVQQDDIIRHDIGGLDDQEELEKLLEGEV